LSTRPDTSTIVRLTSTSLILIFTSID